VHSKVFMAAVMLLRRCFCCSSSLHWWLCHVFLL